MKKFVFLAHGEMDRTPEFQQAHRAWWSSILRTIWLERIRGLIRSDSVSPIESRIAAPAARVSACSAECTSSMPKYRSMTCMPGRTLVAFRATSVSRLISMPGEISTYSEASPGSGRNHWSTVPRNASYCGCRLSRKQYARSSMPLLNRTLPRLSTVHRPAPRRSRSARSPKPRSGSPRQRSSRARPRRSCCLPTP